MTNIQSLKKYKGFILQSQQVECCDRWEIWIQRSSKMMICSVFYSNFCMYFFITIEVIAWHLISEFPTMRIGDWTCVSLMQPRFSEQHNKKYIQIFENILRLCAIIHKPYIISHVWCACTRKAFATHCVVDVWIPSFWSDDWMRGAVNVHICSAHVSRPADA